MATTSEIDQHYKKYLSARYKNVGTSSFSWIMRWIILWLGIVVGSTTLTDIPSYPDDQFPWTILATLAVATSCIWPILILRQRSLKTGTYAPTPAASASFLSTLVRPFFGPPTRRIVGWYAAVSVFCTAIFSFLWEVRHQDVELGLFKSTVLYPYHLNERLLFLMFGNVGFAIVLGLWDVYNGGWNQPKWPRNGETRGIRFEKAVKPLVIALPLSAGVFTLLFFGQWASCRTQVTRWIIQLSGGHLRSFIIRLARYDLTFAWNLPFFRLFVLCINTGLILKVPKILFDVSATQPFDFSPLTSKMRGSDADQYLITALGSNDDYLLNFTAIQWAEISHLSSRRKALFEDIANKPTSWSSLWTNIVIQLNKSSRTLKTRGGRLVSSAPQQQIVAPASIPSLSIQRREQPSLIVPSTISTLARVDQATEKAEVVVRDVSSVVASSWSVAKSGTNELIKRTSSVLSPYTDELIEENTTAQALVKKAEEVRAGMQGVANQIQTIQDKTKEMNEKAKVTVESKTWWRHRWNDNKESLAAKGWYGDLMVQSGNKIENVLAQRWAEDEIDTVLPRRMVDLNLIRTLSAFIVGSYDEDRYGQVQQNVPDALALLADFYLSLRAYKQEVLNSAEQTDSPVWKQKVEEMVRDNIDPLMNAIEHAVQSIQTTFGRSMKAFELSAGLSGWINSITQSSS